LPSSAGTENNIRPLLQIRALMTARLSIQRLTGFAISSNVENETRSSGISDEAPKGMAYTRPLTEPDFSNQNFERAVASGNPEQARKLASATSPKRWASEPRQYRNGSEGFGTRGSSPAGARGKHNTIRSRKGTSPSWCVILSLTRLRMNLQLIEMTMFDSEHHDQKRY
jgi:hypothetical protein